MPLSPTSLVCCFYQALFILCGASMPESQSWVPLTLHPSFPAAWWVEATTLLTGSLLTDAGSRRDSLSVYLYGLSHSPAETHFHKINQEEQRAREIRIQSS